MSSTALLAFAVEEGTRPSGAGVIPTLVVVLVVSAMLWLLTTDRAKKIWRKKMRKLLGDVPTHAVAPSPVELGRRAIRVARQAESDAQRGLAYFREHRSGEWRELLDDLQTAGALRQTDRSGLDDDVNVTGIVVGGGAALVEATGRRLLRQHGIDPDEEFGKQRTEATAPTPRIGYLGRGAGSKGNLSHATFGEHLDVAIDNEGTVDAREATFGNSHDDERPAEDAKKLGDSS